MVRRVLALIIPLINYRLVPIWDGLAKGLRSFGLFAPFAFAEGVRPRERAYRVKHKVPRLRSG